MNLGKQIDSLLKRHSSVYISGLGVFQKVHTSATFDSKRNIFLPPISFVEFDHFGTEGYDFLTYLQQLEQLDRKEAELRLESTVLGIMELIQQDGEFVLDNLGSFVSYGNSFVFKPLDLSGFLYTPVKDDYYQPNRVPESLFSEPTIDQNQVTSGSTNSQINNDEPLIPKADNIEKEAEQVQEVLVSEKKESSSYIYGLVAALAILILGGIYYYTTLNPERTLVENHVTIESFPTDTNLSSIDTTFVDSVDSAIELQDTIANEATSQPIEETIAEEKYTIVIGTHKLLDLALEEAKSYNKKGHSSVRVLEPNMSKNLKRVIWDTYPTREKRDSALRVVRKLYKEDAWGSEI